MTARVLPWAAATAVAALAACSSGRTTLPAPPGRASRGTQAPAPSTTAAPVSTTLASTTTTLPTPVPVEALAAAPTNTADLTTALAATEATIHDPATPLTAVPGLGAAEQRLVATLASHADWRQAVLAALPPASRAVVGDAATGDAELSAVPGPTPDAVPPWTIVAPRPADELLADYHRAESTTGVPWNVLAAINLVETRMGRIVGPSSAGAQGPMQFLPSTWAEYGAGGDIHDAGDAISAAARFLRANGAPRDLSGSLYRYNPSSHYVRGVLAYADAMAADARAYYAFYGWRVYVTTTAGTFLLPEGFGQQR